MDGPISNDVPDAQDAEELGPVGTFWASITGLLGVLVDSIYTRLELLFLDLQEGAERVIGLLIWSLIGLFAASMTLLLGALTLIFVFWDTHRILVAGSITGLFALLTLTAVLVVAARIRNRRTLFAATLEEFAKDRAHLKVHP